MANQKSKGLVSTVITIAVLGLAYFIYNNNKATPNQYVVYYSNVKGLQASSPVMLRGVRVGKIESISIQDNGLLKITILVSDELKLHDSTKAVLASAGLVSEKSISLYDTISKRELKPGSTLLSDIDTSIESGSAKITPYIIAAKYLLHTTDSTLQNIKILTSTGIVTQFLIPLTAFEKEMKGYAKSSAAWNRSINNVGPVINNLNNTAQKLSSGSANWVSSLKTSDTQTAQLNNPSITQNLSSISNNLKSISHKIKQAESSDNAAYLNDASAYNNTTKAIDTVNRSLQALQQSPPGFSIFGKSKRKK